MMENTELAEKSMRTLELPAVLNMLAAECVSTAAREDAAALRPAAEKAEVRRRLDETTAAKTMMVVRAAPRFPGCGTCARPWREPISAAASTPGS